MTLEQLKARAEKVATEVYATDNKQFWEVLAALCDLAIVVRTLEWEPTDEQKEALLYANTALQKALL